MEHTHYQIAIDIFSTVGHVLQHFFGLAQINKGQLRMIIDDFEFGLVVELPDGGHKLFWVKGDLPLF